MATGIASLTIHAPTPRPANSRMLNVLSTLSNASVQASQPPLKPSIASGLPTTRTVHPTPSETRQLLREKVNAVIFRRVEASKNTIPFPSSPKPSRARRAKPSIPRVPLSPAIALHNAERRIGIIHARERCFFLNRPRPAARGKRIVSKVPTLPESEVYPPASAPLVLHPMARTSAILPRPRTRRPIGDENTIPFPTEAPARPSALPKAGRTTRAASYSLPRVPFAQVPTA